MTKPINSYRCSDHSARAICGILMMTALACNADPTKRVLPRQALLQTVAERSEVALGTETAVLRTARGRRPNSVNVPANETVYCPPNEEQRVPISGTLAPTLVIVRPDLACVGTAPFFISHGGSGIFYVWNPGDLSELSMSWTEPNCAPLSITPYWIQSELPPPAILPNIPPGIPLPPATLLPWQPLFPPATVPPPVALPPPALPVTDGQNRSFSTFSHKRSTP
jgi:hypothetical protein